jgi:hypothetical protein
MIFRRTFNLICYGMLLFYCLPLYAHHVLGRPSYSLNEDSTTPPSMQVETQIGSYYVTYMVFPAFPSPKEPGRVNLYITRIDNGEPYTGQIIFKVRDNSWFSSREEILGVQNVDDNVFRQGFEFSESGKYIIRAEFEASGEPYQIDFPLQIGDPPALGPIGLTVSLIMIVIVGVNLLQRKRLTSAKISKAHSS